MELEYVAVRTARVETVGPFQADGWFLHALLFYCVANLILVAVSVSPTVNKGVAASASCIADFPLRAISVGFTGVMALTSVNVANLTILPITAEIRCAYSISHCTNISSPGATKGRTNAI